MIRVGSIIRTGSRIYFSIEVTGNSCIGRQGQTGGTGIFLLNRKGVLKTFTFFRSGFCVRIRHFPTGKLSGNIQSVCNIKLKSFFFNNIRSIGNRFSGTGPIGKINRFSAETYSHSFLTGAECPVINSVIVAALTKNQITAGYRQRITSVRRNSRSSRLQILIRCIKRICITGTEIGSSVVKIRIPQQDTTESNCSTASVVR